jgi:hypothetical protein
VALGDALANKQVEVFSAKAGFEPDKWNQTLARAAGLDLPKGLELDPPEPERKAIRDFRGLGYGY